jgi:glycerophosphoryl diester phosphodiesterase
MTARRTLVLGHRGSPRQARENTIEAFARARDDGADGVELDVHRCADGVLVVHHDADVADFGVLAEHPFAVVRATHPWIPTLPEVLDECRGLLVNIEIKNSPADADFDPDERAAAAVVDLLRSRGRTDDVIVSSFHLPSIGRVRSLDATIPTGFLHVLDPPPLEAVAIAAAAGHDAVHPFFGVLNEDHAMEVVAAADARGLGVNPWTVNDPDEIVRLARAGVHAVITDDPALARAALA